MKIPLSFVKAIKIAFLYSGSFPLELSMLLELNFITVIQLWLEMLLDDSEFPPLLCFGKRQTENESTKYANKSQSSGFWEQRKEGISVAPLDVLPRASFQARCSFSKL